jgi:hypothetical protein
MHSGSIPTFHKNVPPPSSVSKSESSKQSAVHGGAFQKTSFSAEIRAYSFSFYEIKFQRETWGIRTINTDPLLIRREIVPVLNLHYTLPCNLLRNSFKRPEQCPRMHLKSYILNEKACILCNRYVRLVTSGSGSRSAGTRRHSTSVDYCTQNAFCARRQQKCWFIGKYHHHHHKIWEVF